MNLSNSSRAPLAVFTFIATLFLATLACTRADVPAPNVVESAAEAAAHDPTELPPEPTPTAVPQPEPTQKPTEALQPEPLVSPTYPPTPTLAVEQSIETILYRARAGDVLRSVALRFGVLPSDVIVPEGQLPAENELLSPGQILFVPRRLGPTGPSDELIPDSELVYSPHAVDFDIEAFVDAQGGFLSEYEEIAARRMVSGAEVVALAARDHSVNPRLLLALIEYHSGWVTNPVKPTVYELRFPLGHEVSDAWGLYRQLTWLANELGTGFYGWRAGTLTEIVFPDNSIVRLAPDLNAGTVGLQYYFSLRGSGRSWAEALSPTGIIETYHRLFGDPFDYSHPLYEAGLKQPELILPFFKGRIWALTGGPHGAWEKESAWAALDFAPSSLETGCAKSDEWVLAAAPGLVARTGEGVVVLDLDGDGEEQTGWNLLYLHVSDRQVQEGDFVETGDLIGHPSCEGGTASGTHLHFARKYNGEWILADGALPFTLSGWVAQAGLNPYQGALIKGDEVVLACICASRETNISR
ncbi:MAG: peptidoglycan DD-metalloendopeptidase family protein [Anaerolineales bacterium]